MSTEKFSIGTPQIDGAPIDLDGPERVEVNGMKDRKRPEIVFCGWASRQPDGTYHAIAIVPGFGLCKVEAVLTFDKPAPA